MESGTTSTNASFRTGKGAWSAWPAALHLWRRPALPHDGGLQPQAEAAPAGAAPEEALQALGTDLAEGDGLGTRLETPTAAVAAGGINRKSRTLLRVRFITQLSCLAFLVVCNAFRRWPFRPVDKSGMLNFPPSPTLHKERHPW